MRVDQLQLIVPNAPMYWVHALVEIMPKYKINTIAREAAFLGQIRHESVELTHFVENLNYTDPLRIVKIFRKSFDADQDRVVDPEEIELAKRYVRNPQGLANRVYANRMGNGDEASGDGWRFRARAPIQLTFHDNYRLYGSLVSVDLIRWPDEALVPRIGAAVSCAYFQHNGCNELADYDNLAGVTKKINPGMAGLNERIALTHHTRKVLEGT